MEEIKIIERHIKGGMSNEESLLFDAQLLIDKELADRYFWQKRAYAAVQSYGRAQLKSELERIHEKLFKSSEHKSFRSKIQNIFKKR